MKRNNYEFSKKHLKAANKIYKNTSGIYATELQARNHK